MGTYRWVYVPTREEAIREELTVWGMLFVYWGLTYWFWRWLERIGK